MQIMDVKLMWKRAAALRGKEEISEEKQLLSGIKQLSSIESPFECKYVLNEQNIVRNFPHE